ncbi:tetratricopeptide repeat protein [Halanaerobium salsuginis]|jgi:tetratricopeptide (TPR) repeat protein|uniref:TolA-binding protein n=1 Tax=Halanaerobium salsuginis TaxID=29563 RepID=A0A1I4MEV8_9FIRM|nr:tetratricopeptide repeat protein [Halanaerobium salsuginis]SFM01497.1 TolA-binding protein [Halanaerobium salsuginis]
MNKNNLHYQNAVELVKNNNVSEAITELKLCLKFDAKNIAVLNLLGLAYYLKCRFDKAEKTWRKSLALKNSDNKARDYLELITKKDFKELRDEYRKILFNEDTAQGRKIKFLKRLIEEYDELIEPYVILGLLYKREGKYQEALKYFYQAYELDSGNKNIKNYILECEAEDKNSSFFNFNSKTNKRSIAIAAVLAFSLFAFFINQSGASPFSWLKNNFSQLEQQEAANNTAAIQGAKITSQEQVNNKDQQNLQSNSQQQNQSVKQDFSSANSISTKISNLNLMDYQAESKILSLEIMQKLLKKEQTKREAEKIAEFRQANTEQQLFNLGMENFQNGIYDEAAAIFTSIFNLTDKDYLRRESLFLLARSHEKQYNYEQAEHFYRIYLSEYPETNYYDEALYNLGLMLNRAGKLEASKNILYRLQSEEPYSEYNNSKVYQILNTD